MGQEYYYPASALYKAFAQAEREQCVVAALYTSQHCPFCIALKREQLSPRMRADTSPCLIVVEIDPEKEKTIRFPAGKTMATAVWAREHKLSLFPTLIMVDAQGRSLASPLIGYSSKDFYPSYLEDQIRAAQAQMPRPPAKR